MIPRTRRLAGLSLLAAAAFLLLGSPAARAELLANDTWISGQPVFFQAGFVAGETAAVRLDPTGPCPCQVDEVRFLFGGAGTTHDVTLRIWDDSAVGETTRARSSTPSTSRRRRTTRSCR